MMEIAHFLFHALNQVHYYYDRAISTTSCGGTNGSTSSKKSRRLMRVIRLKGRRTMSWWRTAVKVSSSLRRQLQPLQQMNGGKRLRVCTVLSQTIAKTMLFDEFTMFKMKGNEKIQSYFDILEVLSNRLANAGVIISDDQLLFRLVSGAPQSMSENIRYIATNVNKLKVVLLDLEARLPPNFQDRHALLVATEAALQSIFPPNASSASAASAAALVSSSGSTVTCSNCHCMGHSKVDCFSKGGGK